MRDEPAEVVVGVGGGITHRESTGEPSETDLDRLTAVTDPISGVSSQSFVADGNRTTLVAPGSNQMT